MILSPSRTCASVFSAKPHFPILRGVKHPQRVLLLHSHRLCELLRYRWQRTREHSSWSRK